MDFYKAKQAAPFDINDFLQLRRRPEAYIVFFMHFIKCITRKSTFERKLSTAKTYDDICTVSDEAFALLVLENSWDRWSDLYKQDFNSLLPMRGRRPKSQVVSHIPTKYTKGGYRYSTLNHSAQSTRVKTHKGWSIEGINRYNALYGQVMADRAAHPEFLDRVLKSAQQGTGDAPKANKQTPKKTPPVTARHNLFKHLATSEATTALLQLNPTTNVNLPPRANPYVEKSIESEEEFEEQPGGPHEEV